MDAIGPIWDELFDELARERGWRAGARQEAETALPSAR